MTDPKAAKKPTPSPDPKAAKTPPPDPKSAKPAPDPQAAKTPPPDPKPTPDPQTAKTPPPDPKPIPDPQAAKTPPPAKPAKRRALVVDDEPANRDFLVRLLEQAKLEVQGASTATQALKIAEEVEAFELIVVDNRLPDMDGIELLSKLHQRYPTAHMIMATMLDERELMTKAFDNGCDVFMVKPHGFMELFRRLQMPGDDTLRRIIIDQYGPRPYRG